MKVRKLGPKRVGGSAPKTFAKPWLNCVGSERMSTALQKEYLDHLDVVQKSIGFKYVRCHGLFSDDLGVFRIREWKGERVPVYNFTNLDKVFDALLDRGIRPFVEFGFMPGDMASGPDTVFYWKGNITPPRDYALWTAMVQSFLRHCIGRWGQSSVREWYFEVWNEPNLTQFWKDADMPEYFRLYDETVRAVKAVDPALRVGGPAISGGADHWIEAFLSHVRDTEVPCDFVSRHMYAGMTPRLRTPELMYQGLFEPRHLIDELRSVRELIDSCGFPHLELHITEFNTSYNPTCPVHDTPLNAAHQAALLAESGDYAATMSYWTFSDVFDEQDLPRALFHGGFGMLALHGIPKPSYYLFEFFSRLGTELLYRDENAVVTRREDGTIAIAVWNPVQDNEVPAELDFEIGLAKVLLPPGAEPGTELVGFEKAAHRGGEFAVTRSRVGDDFANPWGAWIAMGRPRYPSRHQIQVLHQVAVPKIELYTVSADAGGLTLHVRLAKNELSLFELSPFHNESESYMGLNDSLIDGYGHRL